VEEDLGHELAADEDDPAESVRVVVAGIVAAGTSDVRGKVKIS